jgi:hypothetical protein
MEETIDLKLGFFEDVDNVHNVTNLDVYDTLSPLWKNKCELSDVEKRLLMCIVVTNKNLLRLTARVNELEETIEGLKKEIEATFK